MNDKEIVNSMVDAIMEIERKNSRDKFSTEQISKKNTIKEILDVLDEVTKDENKSN
jgi:hypothetical protein